MTAAAHGDQIASYLDRVRAAMSDLPEETRDELLEDLPDHLTEVLAEDAGTLEERLGSPEAYAAELRAAAGMGAAAAPANSSGLRRLRDGLARLDVTAGRLLGYGRASQLWLLMRPGWWVLRGYLAGVLILHVIFTARDRSQWLPLGDSSAIAWLLVIGASVVLSVRVGLATPRLKPWLRTAVAIGAVGLLAFAVAEINRVFYLQPPTMAADVTYGNGITDIYPYDSAGRPLTGVTLFDQNGTRLSFGDPWRCAKPSVISGPSDPSFGDSVIYRWEEPDFKYPLCPPDGWQPAPATPTPSPGPTPTPTPTR